MALRNTLLALAPAPAALALLFSARLPLAAAPDDRTLEHRCAALARAFVDDEGADGLSLVVAVGPDILYEAGFGYADPGTKIVATPDSPYRAGALTPTLVAVLLFDLAEDGALDLEAPVTRYLVELDLGPDDVTLAELLTHTSGLPGYAHAFREVAAFDAAAVLAWLTKEPRLADPGSCFAYSESNDLLAGLVLERVAESTVRKRIETRILEGLSLEGSEYCWDGPALHEHADASRELRGALVSLGSYAQPFDAEGLCMSARDLLSFQRALVEERLLAAPALERLTRSARLDDATETGYGLGVSLSELDGRQGVSYGGGLAGARVHVAYYAEHDLVVALLAHGEDLPLERLERALSRLVIDAPEADLDDLPLSDEEAQRYVGTYVAGCVHLALEHEHGRLVLQAEIGPRWTLLRQAEHVFAAADEPGVTVTFLVEDDEVRALVLNQHGARIEARRQ